MVALIVSNYPEHSLRGTFQNTIPYSIRPSRSYLALFTSPDRASYVLIPPYFMCLRYISEQWVVCCCVRGYFGLAEGGRGWVWCRGVVAMATAPGRGIPTPAVSVAAPDPPKWHAPRKSTTTPDVGAACVRYFVVKLGIYIGIYI